MLFQIEFTDTFAGTPNYSWVQRKVFHAPENASDALLIRRGKAAIKLSGRHTKHQYQDCIELRFPGECVVAFITNISLELEKEYST